MSLARLTDGRTDCGGDWWHTRSTRVLVVVDIISRVSVGWPHQFAVVCNRGQYFMTHHKGSVQEEEEEQPYDIVTPFSLSAELLLL